MNFTELHALVLIAVVAVVLALVVYQQARFNRELRDAVEDLTWAFEQLEEEVESLTLQLAAMRGRMLRPTFTDTVAGAFQATGVSFDNSAEGVSLG